MTTMFGHHMHMYLKHLAVHPCKEMNTDMHKIGTGIDVKSKFKGKKGVCESKVNTL